MRTKPKIELDLAKVEQYAQCCDNDEEIARALGISPRTLYGRKRDFADFAEAIKRGRAKASVFVGGQLMQLIKAGNTAATIFYLKSRCGWKETDRHEITGADGDAIKVASEVKQLTTEQLLEIARMSDDEGETK